MFSLLGTVAHTLPFFLKGACSHSCVENHSETLSFMTVASLFIFCSLPFKYRKVKVLVAQTCPTLCDPMNGSRASLLCAWNSPGMNTGVGCHALLQGIFLTLGSNSHLLHWQADSLLSEPPGKPLQV